MRPVPSIAALAAFLLASSPSALVAASSSDSEATTTYTACTAASTSGAFYDLRADIAVKADGDDGSSSKKKKRATHSAPTKDYEARGYDYGHNFTLNICEPVVKEPVSVVGVKEELWRNISAYYVASGDTYSLGQHSGNLTARGKELVLQYTGGSPCGKKKKRSESGSEPGSRSVSVSSSGRRSAVHAGAAWKDYDSDDNTTEVDTLKKHDDDEYERRKSATIFFSCDKDPIAEFATASFIAADPEECHYVFKVKSRHACAGAEPHKPGSVGAGAVFLIILAIAVLVYLLGGIFYNRTVSNARGWKQLPNYSLWASVWGFITVGTLPQAPTIGSEWNKG